MSSPRHLAVTSLSPPPPSVSLCCHLGSLGRRGQCSCQRLGQHLCPPVTPQGSWPSPRPSPRSERNGDEGCLSTGVNRPFHFLSHSSVPLSILLSHAHVFLCISPVKHSTYTKKSSDQICFSLSPNPSKSLPFIQLKLYTVLLPSSVCPPVQLNYFVCLKPMISLVMCPHLPSIITQTFYSHPHITPALSICNC